jgi:hypothetical protein
MSKIFSEHEFRKKSRFLSSICKDVYREKEGAGSSSKPDLKHRPL